MIYLSLKILFIIFIILIILNIIIFVFIDPPNDIESKHPYYALFIKLSYNSFFILSLIYAIYIAIAKKKLIFTLSASFLFVIVSHYFSSKRKEPIDKKTFLLFWLGWLILIAGLL